jgi:hypothetical protein
MHFSRKAPAIASIGVFLVSGLASSCGYGHKENAAIDPRYIKEAVAEEYPGRTVCFAPNDDVYLKAPGDAHCQAPRPDSEYIGRDRPTVLTTRLFDPERTGQLQGAYCTTISGRQISSYLKEPTIPCATNSGVSR